MPVQFPHSDQVPELTYAGYAGLGAGIGGGIESIGRALEKRAEERKRLAQAGKAADAFYKALPEDQLPIPPDEWALLSAVDKASAMQGIIGAGHYKRGVADTQQALMHAAAQRQEQANAARYPEFARLLAAAGQPGVPQLQDFYEGAGAGGAAMPSEAARPMARPLDLRDLMEASSASRYTPKLSELDDLLRATAAGGRQADLAMPPELFTLKPGVEGVYSRKTGKYDLLNQPAAGQSFEQKVELMDRQNLYAQKRALTAARSRAVLPAEKEDYQKQIDAVDAAIEGLGKTAQDRVAEAKAYADQLEQERLKVEADLKKLDAKLGTAPKAPASKAGEGDAIMINPQGRQVLVPRGRLSEAIGLGYRMAQ